MTIRILFVCTGNICRSPSAEGVLRALIDARGLAGRIETDSAGTGDWHVGEPPDPRAIDAAAARGIDIAAQRARQIAADDFGRFDLIVALDDSHHDKLTRAAPLAARPRIRRFVEFAPGLGIDGIPDPYYGGRDGFDMVLDMIEAGCIGLLEHVQRRKGGEPAG